MPMRYSLRELNETTEAKNSGIKVSVIYTKSDFPSDIERVFGNHTPKDEEVYYTGTPYFNEIMYFKDDYYLNKWENDLPQYVLFFHNQNELLEIRYRGNRTPEEIIENVERVFSANEK